MNQKLSQEEKERRKEERRLEKYNKIHRINEDGTNEKICSDCQQWFPSTEEYFYPNKANTVDVLNPYCKECQKKRSSNWWRENKEHYDTVLRPRWYKKESYKAYTKRNQEQKKDKMVEYRKNNKEKMRQYCRDRELHKKHIISRKEWQECLEYFNDECAYCGMTLEEHKEKFKQQLHKEHFYNDGANDLSNCIPSCRTCNSEKTLKKL